MSQYELIPGGEKRHRVWIVGNQGGPLAGCYRCKWTDEDDNIVVLKERADAHERRYVKAERRER